MRLPFLDHSKRRIISLAATFIALMLALSACALFPELESHTQRMMTPTGESVRFSRESYSDFEHYIAQSHQHLLKHKVFLEHDRKREELQAALPFRLEAQSHCPQTPKANRGAVLIHGLGDTPGTMQDLATALSNQCFLVYGVLLPGHGARSAELIDVSFADWVAAARFAVDELKTEVHEVYVGGFSLGGLTATQVAMLDTDIAGLIAISPAIALRRSGVLGQTIWLRHLVDWVDRDAQDDAWRFEPMPINGVAQTVLLSKHVQTQLENAPLKTPAFIALSSDDAVIDAATVQTVFEHSMPHSQSRLIDYTVSDQATTSTDNRIIEKSSELLEENILSYSHLAVHVSPDNPRYGRQGSYRSCGFEAQDNASDPLSTCSNAPDAYRGEVYGPATRRHAARNIDQVVRLTYNPQFDDMLVALDAFIQETTRLKP